MSRISNQSAKTGIALNIWISDLVYTGQLDVSSLVRLQIYLCSDFPVSQIAICVGGSEGGTSAVHQHRFERNRLAEPACAERPFKFRIAEISVGLGWIQNSDADQGQQDGPQCHEP